METRLHPSHLLGAPAWSVPGRVSVHRFVLGNVGRCPHVPTHTILVFDDSGSVVGGNDPIGNRFIEARLALEAVASRCRCGDELVSVLHFDTPGSADLSPTRESSGRARLSVR